MVEPRSSRGCFSTIDAQRGASSAHAPATAAGTSCHAPRSSFPPLSVRPCGTRASMAERIGARSSGRSAARKLVPYTATLQAEINNAVGPWIVDLFRQRPDLMNGPAYWSISPSLPDPAPIDSEIPVGFDDDSDYLGGLASLLVARVLAAPPALRHLHPAEVFRPNQFELTRVCKDVRIITGKRLSRANERRVRMSLRAAR